MNSSHILVKRLIKKQNLMKDFVRIETHPVNPKEHRMHEDQGTNLMWKQKKFIWGSIEHSGSANFHGSFTMIRLNI
ncbi:unnamed protein product [Hermetia illucens]|uniref:Uncharacterized protein n=1 Tax=Hermetia illucens TaxID=343691 RepID=A0A7R8U9Q2_HERIL|nr:unnamed protein product [Hermetia illucens]